MQAFTPEIEDALEHPVDFKSALQERLARRGELVSYEVVDEQGPPHDRTFTVERHDRRAEDRARLRAQQEGRRAGGGAERPWRRCEMTAATLTEAAACI